MAGAIEDLDLAERQGAAPDTLAAARLSLADKVSAEVRGDLDAGEPARVVERVEQLARHKVGGPAVAKDPRDRRGLADSPRRSPAGVSSAGAHDQLDRGGAARGRLAQLALAGTRRDIEARQKAAAPRVEALYTALAAGKWPEILNLAESVLETIPEHPAARQARTRAWQQIGALKLVGGLADRRGARVPQSASSASASPTGVRPNRPARTTRPRPLRSPGSMAT